MTQTKLTQYNWPYKLPNNLKNRLMVQRLTGCSLDNRYVYHCTMGCRPGRKFSLDTRCTHYDDRVKCSGFFECRLCYRFPHPDTLQQKGNRRCDKCRCITDRHQSLSRHSVICPVIFAQQLDPADKKKLKVPESIEQWLEQTKDHVADLKSCLQDAEHQQYYQSMVQSSSMPKPGPRSHLIPDSSTLHYEESKGPRANPESLSSLQSEAPQTKPQAESSASPQQQVVEDPDHVLSESDLKLVMQPGLPLADKSGCSSKRSIKAADKSIKAESKVDLIAEKFTKYNQNVLALASDMREQAEQYAMATKMEALGLQANRVDDGLATAMKLFSNERDSFMRQVNEKVNHLADMATRLEKYSPSELKRLDLARVRAQIQGYSIRITQASQKGIEAAQKVAFQAKKTFHEQLALMKLFKADDTTDLNAGQLFYSSLENERLQDYVKVVQTTLGDVDRALNKSQLAVALWLAATRKEYAKISVTVPAGLGKSRIMLGLALLLLHTGFRRIVIAFPTKTLEDQESTSLQALETLAGDAVSFIVPDEESDLKLQGGKVALLMDEGDTFLLDRLWEPKASFVVALTATAMVSFESTERLVLRQKRRFHLLDAGFISTEPATEEVESLEEFLELTEGMPRLIFGTHDLMEQLMSVDTVKKKILSELVLDQIHNLSVNDVVFVEDEEWMRGIDYRTTHPAGIALLLAQPSTSLRAYRQALGRVGRYQTPCKRFQLANTDTVDPQAQRNLLGRMSKLIHQGQLTGIRRRREKDALSHQP